LAGLLLTNKEERYLENGHDGSQAFMQQGMPHAQVFTVQEWWQETASSML
jgi:hypothetical protein